MTREILKSCSREILANNGRSTEPPGNLVALFVSTVQRRRL